MDRNEQEVSDPASAGTDARSAPGAAVRLDAVVRKQGAFTLGPLDMAVPSGLVTGFVGPNGAGKTTAIKAMLGMVDVESGSIRVLGAAPGARPRPYRRRHGCRGPAPGVDGHRGRPQPGALLPRLGPDLL